mmetsp:Transcript_13559/g.11626  ORF Transcript_13559/g.11626 Transcript_13559/m.11626 type:complete len:106 (+) Transcript_13559:65-382(+)
MFTFDNKLKMDSAMEKATSPQKMVSQGYMEKPRDFKVLRCLSEKKHKIYLTHSQKYQQYFALKIFPYANGRRDPNYENEQRFTYLKHENIIASSYNFDKRITKDE